MKKIIALLLTVAMIASFTTVAVVAETDIDFTISQPSGTYIVGDEITVEVSMSNTADKATPSGNVTLTYDSEVLEFVSIAGSGIMALGVPGASKLTWAFAAAVNTGGTPQVIATAKYRVKSVPSTDSYDITLTPTAYTDDGDSYTVATSKATVSLVRTFDVKDGGVTAIAEKQPVELGTSKDDVIKALNNLEFNVVGAVETDTATLKATGWTSEKYNADVVGDYTFTGTLQAVSPVTGFATEADATVTATVAVTPIALTADMFTTSKEAGIKQSKAEGTTADSTEIKKVLPAKIEYAANGYTGSVDVVAENWVISGDLDLTAEVGTYVTATYKVNPTDNFSGTDVEFVVTVKVVPATVAGATLKNNNKSINAVPSVTITVPASAVEEDTPATDTAEAVGNNTVVVTITADGLKTNPLIITKSRVKKSELVDENGASIAYTITGEESYRSLGLTSATDIVITATLNGAALAGTPAEDGSEAPVLSETDTVKKPVSSGGPSYISPSGSSSNGNDQTGSTGSTDTTTPDDTDKPVVDTPVVEAPFDDVAGDHWAAEAIATLKDAGIVGGVTATTFAPDADITRAEFTKMVVGLLKLEAASTEVAFEDCGAEDWYTPYVAAAVEAGLVTGVSETEFAPNATITREQAFAIIGRAVIDAEANTTLAYTDAAEVSEYAVPYVTLLTQEGIVGGFGDGTVRPQANITRAEAAKVIAGLMANVVTEEEVAEDNAEKATEEVAEEAKEDAAEETTEETTETEAADKTAEEDVAEETAEDAADKTTEE